MTAHQPDEPGAPGGVWALVLAAGGGRRFGGAKQFALAGVRRLVDLVVSTAAEACDAVVVVLPEGVAWDGPPVQAAVAGGPTRADSVRRGLAAVPAHAGIVVVHDAAHPLATAGLFRAVVAAVRDGAAAAVPGLPLAEVLKRVEGGRVVATVPRDGVVQAQTPHAFRADVLRRAHAGAPDAPEDSVLVEALGLPVAVVAGEPANLHVTTADDLALVDAYLARRRGEAAPVW